MASKKNKSPVRDGRAFLPSLTGLWLLVAIQPTVETVGYSLSSLWDFSKRQTRW